jgi:hypothetical protein
MMVSTGGGLAPQRWGEQRHLPPRADFCTSK